MDKNTNKIDERLDILSSILESDEKMIVYLYLGFHTKEKLSLDQIAKFMGTSREPVRKRLMCNSFS